MKASVSLLLVGPHERSYSRFESRASDLLVDLQLGRWCKWRARHGNVPKCVPCPAVRANYHMSIPVMLPMATLAVYISTAVQAPSVECPKDE